MLIQTNQALESIWELDLNVVARALYTFELQGLENV